ncbi:MAG: flagellar biosynthesis protein FlhF [Synergistaceae bacterium]|nr:flagellar biosynthesis protein FlhF [Synergistaceae bacterium]
MRVLNQITFEAKDDAEALKLAGERLGKDAVILSTRVVRVGGFMGLFQRHVLQVSAGILQDESKPEKKEKDNDAAAKERLVAFQKLLEFKQATEPRGGGGETQEAAYRGQQPILPTGVGPAGAAPAGGGAAKIIYSPAGVGAGVKNPREFDSVHISQAGLANAAEAQVSPGENGDAETLRLREEVDHLTKRLDTILKHLESPAQGPLTQGPSIAPVNDKFEPGLMGVTPAAPAQVGGMEDVYQRLVSSEMEPNYALSLVQEYKGNNVREPFAKWLESRIKCAADTSPNALGGKKIMLFGPTGAGKTTTIAKLAAIQALWEHKNVLLLTSDTYRIAAVDQLRTYAKILGVPIEVIFEVENFTRILAEHENAELILLDTAGRGQKDRKNLEAFETLHKVFKPDAVHLVLAANMKYKDMLDVVERMSGVPISHVIFTKLDETVSYGPIFNLVKSLDLPVSFFTTGQNVPNDIEVASGARLAGLLMGDEVRSAAP